MTKKKYFLDIAHMHPICPLSLSHARIFVLADVLARWRRKQGYFVRFPICMHYSGSTVFKITRAASNFLQKRKLNDSDQKALDLIFNFYKIPKDHLYKFTEPISVLDYFSDIILKDLRKIQVSCNYNNYFNTTNQWYKEFVRSVFDVYAEKKFITTYNNKKSLNYSNSLFRDRAVKRLGETEFLPLTAKTMVAESLERLDSKWSFKRIDAIGTRIGEYVVDPMFDAEFLSIFNTIYPYLKVLSINQTDARDIFKEFLYKVKDPNRKVSSIANELYSRSQEILPVDVFFVERHLQNWVAKRVYTEAILLPSTLSTREYFFLGSITEGGQVDSASRGRGKTLSQLIDTAGQENTRLALLLTFGAPHKDYEWASTTEHIKRKLRKFNIFVYSLKKYSIDERHHCDITNTLKSKKDEIEDLIERGNIRKILLIIFDELPTIIHPMIMDLSRRKSKRKSNREVLNFLGEYLHILCPSLSSKIHES